MPPPSADAAGSRSASIWLTSADGAGAVGRWDRLMVFGALNLAAAVCFLICFGLSFILVTVYRKFAIVYVSPLPSPRRPLVQATSCPASTAAGLSPAGMRLPPSTHRG